MPGTSVRFVHLHLHAYRMESTFSAEQKHSGGWIGSRYADVWAVVRPIPTRERFFSENATGIATSNGWASSRRTPSYVNSPQHTTCSYLITRANLEGPPKAKGGQDDGRGRSECNGSCSCASRLPCQFRFKAKLTTHSCSDPD